MQRTTPAFQGAEFTQVNEHRKQSRQQSAAPKAIFSVSLVKIKSPLNGASHTIKLVAGVGFEPTAFGL